jgi:L-ascorbate metabolism protein UlaG (beta-lactamase superfamily)
MLLTICLSAFLAQTPAYVSSPRRLLTAPELKDAPDEWLGRSFAWVDATLAQHPPGITEHPVRRAALIRLDDILHIESAPQKPLVQRHFTGRMDRALAEIENTRVISGMRVWKLYDHGFLIRSAQATFAIDIVPGAPGIAGFRVSQAWVERIAAQADALFISHWHDDHASEEVAQAFLALGKPVVAPPGLWKDKAISAKLTYPERKVDVVHRVAKFQAIAFPGHQGSRVLNNNYLITTPDGFTVMHTGDQSVDAETQRDWDWISQVGHRHHVDVYLPNCWMDHLDRAVRGVNPRLVITGHENEMAHTVPHREDYTQTFNRLHGIPYPALVMTWGESYLYQK